MGLGRSVQNASPPTTARILIATERAPMVGRLHANRPIPQRRAIAWFTRKNYARHRALDPAGLPPTYDEWLTHAEFELARMPTATRVVIDPVRFAAWCRTTSRPADASARAAFALIVAAATRRRGWWPNRGVDGQG